MTYFGPRLHATGLVDKPQPTLVRGLIRAGRLPLPKASFLAESAERNKKGPVWPLFVANRTPPEVKWQQVFFFEKKKQKNF